MDLSGSTATAAGFGRKYINDYTLTMDVWFPQLPSDSLSLFQAGGGIVKTKSPFPVILSIFTIAANGGYDVFL